MEYKDIYLNMKRLSNHFSTYNKQSNVAVILFQIRNKMGLPSINTIIDIDLEVLANVIR